MHKTADEIDEARQAVLERARWAGRQTVEKLSLDLKTLRNKFKRELRNAVIEAYLEVLPLIKGDDDSFRAVANRWLMSGGAAQRIIAGERGPSFETACLIATAENVEFPGGQAVALRAERAAFEFVLSETGLPGERGLSDEKLLALYFMARSPEWEEADFRGTAHDKEAAARNIARQIREYVAELALRIDAEALQELRKKNSTAWAVREVLSSHEWF